jgi:hypothetical protein
MAKQFIVLELGTISAGVHPILRYVRVPKDFGFTIEHVDVSAGAPNGAGDAVFNVRTGPNLASLTTIFAMPADRPKIASGATDGEVTGLSEAVAAGSYIVFDADSIPLGGLSGPVFITARVEDGTEAVALTWRDQYNSLTAYHKNDVVKFFDEDSFTSTAWIAVADSTGVTPGTDPTKWAKLIEPEQPKIATSEIVSTLYDGALSRPPDSTELSDGVTALEAARQSAIDFIAEMKAQGSAIFGLSEYTALGTTNAEYVTDLYQALLGREPENMTAFDAWVAVVVADGRAAALSGFVDSAEFYEHRIVRGYQYAITGFDAASINGIKITGTPGLGKTLVFVPGTGGDPDTIEWQTPAGGGSLPTGGTTGQVLTKQSSTDGDADWETPAGAAATTYLQDVLAYSPEFHFRLSETSGTFADSTPHATVGTLNGSGATRGVTGLLAGDANAALQVAGAADVSIPSAARFQPTGAITLIALFKPAATAAASPLITSNHTDYWSQGRGFHLTIDAAGKAHAIIDMGGAAFVHCAGSTITQGGQTYHVAAVFDGETVKVYLNGILEGSVDFPHLISWANQTDLRLLSNVQAGGGTQVFAAGVGDEMTFIAAALTSEQVRALAVKALGQVEPPAFIDLELIDGFVPVWVDAATITIGRGACYIPSERGVKRLDAPVTTTLAAMLGTSAAASTWYYVFAYFSGGRLQFEASATAPAFYGVNASIKPGNFSRRFTGICLLTNSSGNIDSFYSFCDEKREVFYLWRELTTSGIWRLLSSANPGNGSTSAPVDVSAVVPDVIFNRFRFHANMNVGAGDVLNLGILGDTTIPFSGWYECEYSSRIDLRNGSASATGQVPSFGEIHLFNGRQFVYIIGYVSSGSVTLDAKGFSVRR